MAEAIRQEVVTSSGRYPVVVAPGVAGLGAEIAALPGGPDRAGPSGLRRIFVVTDEIVGSLHLSRLLSELRAAGWVVTPLVVPLSEASKGIAAWWDIVQRLLQGGVDRGTPVVAFGGGVVGDVVGFAAASVMRGVPLVQVPTTLLAMVDSSVGGKTGFNTDQGKNLVGAFHQPILVWAPLDTLKTLPVREIGGGLAEVVKHALIADAEMFEALERRAAHLGAGVVAELVQPIVRSVAIKAAVVAADEKERGGREVLNLGHTVGHAVETVSGHGVWLHGEAVAMGLVAELAWAARRAGEGASPLVSRLRSLLARLGLPQELPPLERVELIRVMALDKKSRGGMVTLPVCRAIGRVELIRVGQRDLEDLVRS